MRRLILVPIGGLANRINSITSAIAFCQDHSIRLKVFWFKDKGMGADFHSLFHFREEFKENMSNIEIIDSKWFHYIYDRPRKKNLWLPWIFQRMLFDKRSYEKDIISLGGDSVKIEELFKKYNKVYLVHCSLFYDHFILDNLQLEDTIQDKVNKVTSYFINRFVIGIHIRRTDNISAIKKSPLELFFIAMDREIERNPEVYFYLATDSCEEKCKLINRYDKRIITSSNTLQRDTQDGIVNALVEMYALSRTEKIYGSASSTFSVLAAKLSGINLQILSVD